MVKRRILEIRISGHLSEVPARFSWSRAERIALYDVEAALRRARDDAAIPGVWLVVSDATIGWSQAASLHRAVRDLRAAGKITAAFLSSADNATYLAASACEHLVLAPSAVLSLQSLSSEGFFVKDLLGDLGIGPEIDAVGEFKSAGEVLERREWSAAHREQMESILTDLHAQFVERVAAGRGLPASRVSESIASGPFLPDEARARGLIDHVEHEDFCRSLFVDGSGAEPAFVAAARYAAPPGWIRRLVRWRRPQIAVVHACGVLTTGDRTSSSSRGPLGARALSELLRSLRGRRKVRAVVLRVDSPGGGAFASDVIHREVLLTAEEKPVVVSMGDIAASGGYYIAAAAHAVVAEGTSLTGSIGVVGGKLVVKRLLDRLGIARESVALGVNAGTFSPLRSFTESERAWHQRHLEHFYRARFLRVVAEGRRLTMSEADRAGRGRVWTGRQGREMGLVDELGGLHDAIDLAFDKAGLSRAKSRVVVHGRRARWRDLFSLGVIEGSILTDLVDKLALVEELAREELLLLLPRVFRIR